MLESIEIFFCYAQEDEVLRQGLEKQLRALWRQGVIDMWHDRMIEAGTEWEPAIDQHLNTAQIILLLISSDFMNSDYCYGKEMKRAMERQARGEARVIPIILRPVYWQRAPFGKLQALPTDGVPIISEKWRYQDDAFFNVAEGIRIAVETITKEQQPPIDRLPIEETVPGTPMKEDATQHINKSTLPGSPISARPLHFIWIIDISSSMAGNKIQSLNTAIREAIPEMRNVASSNPNADVKMRAITFSNNARWHISQPTSIDKFQWQDVVVEGSRKDMGQALLMIADELKMPPMDQRGYPPVLVLITDGYPTDDVNRGIKAIMEQPWGKKAVRIAIGIGDDADYPMLQKFIGHSEIRPLKASSAEQLVGFVKWASTTVLDSDSRVTESASKDVQDSDSTPPLNIPPPLLKADDQRGDVW